MASVQPKFGWSSGLRKSYTCAAAVTGAHLVEQVAGTDLVQHAGALSTKVVGVALDDVPASRATIQGPQVGDGHELTVFRGGVVPVVFSGAANEGDLLVAGAAGVVSAVAAVDNTNAGTVATGVTNTRAIIGRAEEVAADGETKLARIF